MEFLADDREGEHARVQWLIRLRWAAVLGVLSAIATAGPVLGLLDHPLPLYLLVTALGTWNLWLHSRVRHGKHVLAAGRQVVFDLLILGGLLLFSGGLQNPFSVFLAVQVILGAILLPRPTAVNVGLVGMAISVLLATLAVVGLIPATGNVVAKELPIWGVGLALVLTMAVALQLVIMVMEDRRARARQARQYHEQAERERQKLFDVMRFVGASMVLLDDKLNTEWQNRRSEGALGKLERGTRFHLPGGPPGAGARRHPRRRRT